MRTIKEESDCEQLEAAILHCEREFEKEMGRINREHAEWGRKFGRRAMIKKLLPSLSYVLISICMIIIAIYKRSHP